MKVIDVVCAIIEDHGKVLAAQRNVHMDLPLLWEFPGGKVEAGETVEATLRREIKEELGIEVQILLKLNDVTHVYESKTINLIPFICSIKSGKVLPVEHKRIFWSDDSDLLKLMWCPADIPVVSQYLNVKKSSIQSHISVK